MAASMKCSECRKVKRCCLYRVRTVPEGETPGPIKGWLAGEYEYLCRPCARILGYLDTASTTVDCLPILNEGVSAAEEVL